MCQDGRRSQRVLRRPSSKLKPNVDTHLYSEFLIVFASAEKGPTLISISRRVMMLANSYQLALHCD